MSDKDLAAAIANKALETLRARGLDCVGGPYGNAYGDASGSIYTAILHAARDVLKQEAAE